MSDNWAVAILRAITVASTILTTGLAAAPVRGQSRLAVGQPHPDFLLPRIDSREPVALSQFRGKKVLLIQFASW